MSVKQIVFLLKNLLKNRKKLVFSQKFMLSALLGKCSDTQANFFLINRKIIFVSKIYPGHTPGKKFEKKIIFRFFEVLRYYVTQPD